jgi:transcriptional regulator with XRE-family HTH domain
VTHPPLLIREIERLAKERGWSTAATAQQLGLSDTAFRNVRLGHRIVSLGLLSKIAETFKTRAVKELVIHYLTNEYPTYRRSRHGARAVIATLPASTTPFARWQIAEWLAQLPSTEGVRRGLFLTADDASLLGATARHIAAEIHRAGIAAFTLAANARVSASMRETALETAVLIVERLDHVSDAVAGIIEERGNAFRPVIATSLTERDALTDPILVRTLRATTTAVALTPSSTRGRAHADASSPSTHVSS